MNYLLFNPLARNNQGTILKEQAKESLKDTFDVLEEKDVTKMDVDKFIADLKEEDILILVGGDGTLNKFANYVYELKLNNKMYLYRAGTGNDFLKDVCKNENETLFLLNPYLKRLPKVTINNKTTRYINGIGYGLDGQVCVDADKLKAKGKKKINYTTIAIKLLFKLKCPDATVIVDGVEKHFKNVWIASAMNGRFYGGGMMLTPNQNRLDDELTCCVVHSASRLKTLILFPKIFKGEHIKYKKIVDMQKGKRIEVRFSSPASLQIDGEAVENVTSYVAEID